MTSSTPPTSSTQLTSGAPLTSGTPQRTAMAQCPADGASAHHSRPVVAGDRGSNRERAGERRRRSTR
ncbi:hypothetical protein KCH_17920 [Kitasatospora cheerisanensis KCTC 2395]|uniref:Uncharacterized protein n=1 Tax=Kitasatospora cheerisanensis KCTC 2395 TaxID=1348663 RepID=A0A066Z718_9ACTN|nr:hypothetical protein KCH_17920 [Kitasatospora cheerisanensis KCTC 2395]